MSIVKKTLVPLAALVSNHTQLSAGMEALLNVATFPPTTLVVEDDVVKAVPALFLAALYFNW